MSIRHTLVAAFLAALFALPTVASAGSYQVQCRVKAKFDGKTYDLLADHYSSKKDANYTSTPNSLTLDVDSKSLKLKSKKKVGGLWFYDFKSVHVVYAGTAKEGQERWAFFYGPDGEYIARVSCK